MDENERQARRAVVSALAILSTAFGKEMPDEQIDIYINALCDLAPSGRNDSPSCVARQRTLRRGRSVGVCVSAYSKRRTSGRDERVDRRNKESG